MKLNEIANDINQVNSHGKGYSKIITLPPKIAEKSYSIVVTKNCVMLDDKSIRAKSDIIPFNLVNENDKKLQEFILYGGGSYLIKSQNDSKILIKRIG